MERHSDGDWAWLAALRAGCSELLGERRRARDEYRLAARRYSTNPIASVLGLTYAARISEWFGEKRRALVDYRAARSAWNREYGQSYAFGSVSVTHDKWSVTRHSA